MSEGRLMDVDTPEALRTHVRGTVYEIVCNPVRSAAKALQATADVDEVQAFGDRITAIVPGSGPDAARLTRALTREGVTVESIRTVPPSLENVFLSLLAHPRGHEERP